MKACILGCAGPSITDDERRFFRQSDPFGFILFARNVETPKQLLQLTTDLRDSVGRDAPILIDQEGGRVQRMRAPHWREWSNGLDVASQVAEGEAAVAFWLRYRLIAAELRAVGIDTNCAPLGDIARPETHEILRGRCYGTTPEEVIVRARAVADGLQDGGVLPVLKHMPGHGLAQLDTHLELPRVSESRTALAETDFAPFAALSDLPFGMTAHIVFEDIDPDLPATLSPSVVRLIRNEIGFRGLLMTDDLSMHALSGPYDARAALALAAGCDLVLHCNGNMEEMTAVAGGTPPLTTQASEKAAAALAKREEVEPADLVALSADLKALVKARQHV